MPEETGDVVAAEFVQELTTNAKRIYGYILTRVPNWADADEIYQDTCRILWEKRQLYVSGTSFHAWAFRVVDIHVKTFRKDQAKKASLFSDAFADAVERGYQTRSDGAASDETERRQEALGTCLSKLSERNFDLIVYRYQNAATAKTMASTFGRSTEGIYKALSRIHSFLIECVHKTLSREGG